MNGSNTSSASSVSNVGCGELFIVAGQSLVANWGQTLNTPSDSRIMHVDFNNNWTFAADPQPVADQGNGSGSPIPAIGNALVAHLNMPVGFLDVAIGGTTIANWNSTLYTTNLLPAIRQFKGNQFRSIIWEQGNTDGEFGTSIPDYEAGVTTLINRARTDANWATMPWGIADQSTIFAGVSYASTIGVAQDFLAANTANAYAGSNTDSITSADRFDTTHYNAAGQAIQGGMWATAIINYFHAQGVPGY